MPRLYSLGHGLTLEQPEKPSGGGQEAVAPAPTGKSGDPGRDAKIADVAYVVTLGNEDYQDEDSEHQNCGPRGPK